MPPIPLQELDIFMPITLVASVWFAQPDALKVNSFELLCNVEGKHSVTSTEARFLTTRTIKNPYTKHFFSTETTGDCDLAEADVM